MPMKVRVHFSIPYRTNYGEHMQIHLLDETGKTAAGEGIIRMDWSEGNVWHVTKVFTFDDAGTRAQTAPFVYCFEVAKESDGFDEVVRADCPQLTMHHSLDIPALLAKAGKLMAPETVAVDVHELWDFPDQQTVEVVCN